MSYQEKRSIVYMVSTLLISAFYYIYIFRLHPEKGLDPTPDFQFWGIAILLIVPTMLLVNFLNHLFFNIANTIATKEKGDSFSDELDKLVAFRADRNAYSTFMFGFLIAMGTQALGMVAYLMFHILIVSLLAASLMWSSSHLYFYRRGF
ncbi:MAG: hypothetical protein RIF36_20810 [Imperialibacter sp.]|uniref:hypothetical protein n=1 Tax=Imperialibacter sp. TaxID=2038411 RepID=UPI0032EBB445